MHRGRLLAAGTLAELRRGVAEARIRVRVRPAAAAQVLAGLPHGVRCAGRDDVSLTLEVGAGTKMPVLRALAQAGEAVEDIETSVPGLQEIHDRLVGAAGEPA